jgi:hypothetical protein
MLEDLALAISIAFCLLGSWIWGMMVKGKGKLRGPGKLHERVVKIVYIKIQLPVTGGAHHW